MDNQQDIPQPLGWRLKRYIQIYSNGSALCHETVKLIQELADATCDVEVLELDDPVVLKTAADLGIHSVRTVVITASKLAACCAGGVCSRNAADLQAAGVGQPLPGDERRFIEIFSDGSAECHEAIELVERIACRSCQVVVHDLRNTYAAALAQQLKIRSLPTIVITASELVDCCSGGAPDANLLRQAGVGQPVQLYDEPDTSQRESN